MTLHINVNVPIVFSKYDRWIILYKLNIRFFEKRQIFKCKIHIFIVFFESNILTSQTHFYWFGLSVSTEIFIYAEWAANCKF